MNDIYVRALTSFILLVHDIRVWTMAHASPCALGLSLDHWYGELMRGAGFDARPEAQEGTPTHDLNLKHFRRLRCAFQATQEH